jgi:hypothetical protein
MGFLKPHYPIAMATATLAAMVARWQDSIFFRSRDPLSNLACEVDAGREISRRNEVLPP